MKNILDDEVSTYELSRIEKKYNQDKIDDRLEMTTIYQYAHHLIKSRYSNDNRRGIQLLEELFETNPENRRDYLYYLAIGYAKLHEYAKSKNFIKEFLRIEPKNKQMLDLEALVQRKLDHEGLKGMLLLGGAAVVVGSIVTAGVSLLSRK